MRVGFYLAPDQPVERVLPQVARKALDAGERMLVVAADRALLARIDDALWEASPEAFLAHGHAGEPHSERQPILLSPDCIAGNEARLVALADGEWRDEAAGFDRVFLFFDEAGRQAARQTWRQLDGRAGTEREFYEHENGRWLRKA